MAASAFMPQSAFAGPTPPGSYTSFTVNEARIDSVNGGGVWDTGITFAAQTFVDINDATSSGGGVSDTDFLFNPIPNGAVDFGAGDVLSIDVFVSGSGGPGADAHSTMLGSGSIFIFNDSPNLATVTFEMTWGAQAVANLGSAGSVESGYFAFAQDGAGNPLQDIDDVAQGTGPTTVSDSGTTTVEVEVAAGEVGQINVVAGSDGNIVSSVVAECGNGVKEGSEACDEGAANGTPTSCCSATCTFEPTTKVCNSADQLCETDGFCNGAGVCGDTGVKPASTLPEDACRPQGAGADCDMADFCDGVSKDCEDKKFPGGTECSPQQNCRNASFCPGGEDMCPASTPRPEGAVCRSGAGSLGCDIAEVCDGTSFDCPADVVEPDTKLCRDSKGVCDVAEFCDGDGDCPSDKREPAGTECRPKDGFCDLAESCNGSSTDCPDDKGTIGNECRAAADTCDVAEFCSGDKDCPDNKFAPATKLCRPAAPGALCDAPEFCDGAGVCDPIDKAQPPGTICRLSVGVCDKTETCTGGPNCPADAAQPAATICRAAVDVCDKQETCGGATVCPADAKAAKATPCGNPTATGECDLADECDGAGTCDTNPEPAGKLCGDSTDTECDNPDSCDGVGGCTDKNFEDSGTECTDDETCSDDDLCNAAGKCVGDTVPACLIIDPGDVTDEFILEFNCEEDDAVSLTMMTFTRDGEPLIPNPMSFSCPPDVKGTELPISGIPNDFSAHVTIGDMEGDCVIEAGEDLTSISFDIEEDKIVCFRGEGSIAILKIFAVGDDGPTIVGGKLIQIDTVSLALVGLQSNASWLIPVIASALAVGLFLLRRDF